MSTEISHSDFMAITNLIFQWADTFDQKDWDRLRGILGPSVRLDLRSYGGQAIDGLTPAAYATEVAEKWRMGDQRLKTQHLLGGAGWRQVDGDADTVEVHHQVRVASQRYVAHDLAEIAAVGAGYGSVRHLCRKFDGVWKLIAVTPILDWHEGDLFGTFIPEGA